MAVPDSLLATLALMSFWSLFGCRTQKAQEAPWQDYAIDLTTHVLHVKLPSRESSDYPREEAAPRVDPRDPAIYNSDRGFTVLRKYFDDPKASRLSIVGTLTFAVVLHRVPDGATEDTAQLDGLSAFLNRDLREEFDKRSREHLAQGLPPPITRPPDKYERTSFAGRHWIKYRFASRPDSAAYATPLDKKFYLQLHFNLIGERSSWKTDAAALESRILSFLKLEEHG